MWGPMLIRANKQFWLMLLCGLLVAMMCCLGLWQLSRAEEKRKWQAAVMQPKVYTADWFAHIADGNLLRVTGRYVFEQQFLLDNKVVNGAPSYDVITPFIALDRTVFFINRGAVSAPKDRQQLPQLKAMKEQAIDLLMRVYVPSKAAFRLSDAQYATVGWPKRVQYYDSGYFRGAVELIGGGEVFPVEVRLEAKQQGVLQRHWQSGVMSAEKHDAYAFQWFAMAGALLALMGYYRYKKKL